MRLLLKLLGLLLAVVLVAAIVIASNLGGLVKKAVETYAPPLLGTSVVLDSAKVMPWSGTGALRGLEIAQPDGFGEGNAIALGKAALGVDIGSLSGDPVVIDHIIIDGPELNYVQTASGNNIQTLLNNVKRQTGSGDPADGGEPSESEQDQGAGSADTGSGKQPPDQPAKKVIIDQLVISNVSMSASSPLLPGESVSLTLAPIELRDIGREEGGVNAQQVVALVVERLNAEVQRSAADSAELKAMLSDVATEKAREEVDRTLERELGGDRAKQVKGLLDRL